MGGSYQWPSLDEVMEYREQVREMVIEVIENAPLTLPITWDHPWVHKRNNDLIIILFFTMYSGAC